MVEMFLWEEGVEWTHRKSLDCSVLQIFYTYGENSQMAIELDLIIKFVCDFFLFTLFFSIQVNKVSSEHDGILFDCTYVAS